MKDTLTDANFPRTADLRVYHLGLKPGEVANRIVTVGSPSRARTIASYLDASPPPFELLSERGFLTITGRYGGVPITVLSIGMGSPNMDFFVREARECLEGDMVVIRLGSCGALIDVPTGTVVVPKACVCVSRNMDFDFVNPELSKPEDGPPYRISKPISGDTLLENHLRAALESAKGNSDSKILGGIVNAAADSFYSSQGRITSFPDHNDDLIQNLLDTVEDLATLEMETHHLYHLAACYRPRSTSLIASLSPPVTTNAVKPSSTTTSAQVEAPTSSFSADPPRIIASAAQIIFAARQSRGFITPEKVKEVESWAGKGVLDALKAFPIASERLHPESGSVWEVLVKA